VIRLVIADDHALVREGLRSLFEATPDIRVAAEAEDGDSLLQRLRDTPADVVTMDISMPGPGFLDLLARIGRDHPRVRVVVVSMQAEAEYALRAFRAGAMGYVGKDRSSEEVVEAVYRVHRGRKFVSPLLAERLVGTDAEAGTAAGLSDREFQVLCLLGAGVAPKAVARRLSVSPKTVSTYRARVLEKLGLRTDADLVRYVLEHDLKP
jgi:DNA-binding NarL/FixJ family response regulator